MPSRIQHMHSIDNPETLAISQFYANYCNPILATSTTTTVEVRRELESEQSQLRLCKRNRSIFAKTLDSAIHHLSPPGVSHHFELHFTVPIVHRKKSATSNSSFPDRTQKMADRRRLVQGNEHAKRVTVIDRPGQDRVHYTGTRTRHRIVDVLKEFVSFLLWNKTNTNF
ncbi:unnamed protein product [Litomosoides sigmodontis]|uniref:Uncharacterized protein n=1 Tax=Litomosoides sigmodontis TaxID=42156 RepID=A0A3P7JKP6_LITSI|nr:unnamed protein product [Litomosoides sigmodontis]